MNNHRISKSLNLPVIAASGQCFRMNQHNGENGLVYFDVFSKDKYLRIKDEGDIYTFKCNEYDLTYWVNYFDLDTDYTYFDDQISVSGDTFLISALEFSKGMRILRQDYWEATVSFIISQNNNIPRIKKSVEALCERFGEPILYGEDIFYAFPTQDDMKDATLEDFQGLGLGYRDKYIFNLCRLDRDAMRPDFETLIKIPGIGPKVANCILLYGDHQMYQFPVDVWMKRIIDDVYQGTFDSEPYYSFRGYVQQLMFYYYRNMKVRK